MHFTAHILHLENNLTDAELVQATLDETDLVCRITHVRTLAEFQKALGRDPLDLILADHRMIIHGGMAALGLARELRPEVPFIFVSDPWVKRPPLKR